nr:NADH dehydrogenase subunit 4 [Nelidina sp. n.]
MMMMMMMMIFMIPMCLVNLKLIIQFILIYIYMYLLFNDANFFFSKISYFLGLDLFSFYLVLMGLLICSYMDISMMGCLSKALFNFTNLILMLLMYLIFFSLSFIYMYMSFEFVLFPLMVLILGWGYQPERLLAGMYMYIYTIMVSLPLLVMILIIYFSYYSLFFDCMIYTSKNFIIHLILTLVFMMKLPIYLLHFWLPKAHVQAPVSGSMILAGLMLKIGGYGLVRVMFIYEFLFMTYSYIWFSISLLGLIIISLVCMIQGDFKCLIAYSSVSHMCMVVLGLISMSNWGLWGSYLLMLGHGFCSSGLFYLMNLYYNFSLSRSFFINKGLMNYVPSGSMFLFIMCLFNMSCPPSVNFLSEFMILISMENYWFNSYIYFFVFSFFCACFSYYMYMYNQHGLYHNLYSYSMFNLVNFLCLTMHLFPLVFYPLMILSII